MNEAQVRTPAQERQVFRWVNGKRPDQYGFDFRLWTRQIVQEVLLSRFEVKLSLASIGALLARLGLTAQKPLQRACQRDPQAVARWKHETFPAIAAEAQASGAEILFWGDSGFRADAVHGKTWAPRGQAPVIDRPGQRQSISAACAVSAKGAFWFATYQMSNEDHRVSFVASSLPGRIRLRHAALRNPDRLARLRQTIADWPQVSAVSANEKAGSLLVSYDAVALRENDCARRCEAALAEVLPARAEVLPARAQAAPIKTKTAPAVTGARPRAAAPSPARRGAPRVRANRMAKRAMLATLAASMLLAALGGAKRWHIWTGIAFLHALGVHLWVHRRNLLR